MVRIAKQYAAFLAGLFIAALGVAFSTKAGLGTSPVASVPFSVSLANHALSFGLWINIWSLIQIAVQVAVLRGKCNYVEIGVQTALAFVYGYLTDLSCRLLDFIHPGSYVARFALMLAGCAILAFGIFVQYRAGVAMLPGEAMNRAISLVTGRRYENVKVFFDVLYIIAAVAICLVFTGRLEGVREGSVISALLIGNIIRLFKRAFGKKGASQR